MGQQRRVLTPEKSALHLWGSELRAWRDRRSLSLAGLHELIRYDRSYLARLERAEQFPPKHVAEACDRALNTEGELIRLWNMADRERRNHPGHVANREEHVANLARAMDLPPVDQTSSEAEGVVVPCRALDGRIIWVSVPRRMFLLGGLGAAAGAVVGPNRTGPTGPTIRMPRIPDADDVSPVEHLRRVRRVLIDSDNLLGPGHIIPTVHEHIGVIQQLRADQEGADRRSLLHLQAEYAEFAGWLHQDAGDFQRAQFWLDRALEWAHATGDQEMVTFVMARKGQLAGDMRDCSGAVDLAEAAATIARDGSRLQATAATYGAYGHALAGRGTVSLRALDNARELAGRPNDDPGSPWATWLDDAYIEVHRARCLSVLGNHTQAAEIFQQAIKDLPQSFRRDRGVYLAREALAHAGAEDPEQAAATGLCALAIAQETKSGRIITELVRLDSELTRWKTARSVADFREALTSVIPSQTTA